MSLTVFILGAGASKEAGGPLMADFVDTADELRKTIDLGEDRTSFDLVFKALSALQAVHSKSTLNIYNIESVFAAFEMASLFGRLGALTPEEVRGVGPAIRRLIVRTLEERVRLRVEGNSVIPPVPYDKFVNLASGLHPPIPSKELAPVAVITFNYDMALDYALHFRNIRVDYCVETSNDRTRFQVMKLHGSLNWVRCNQCKRIIPWHLEEFFSKRDWNLGIRNRPTSVRLNIVSLLKDFTHCGTPTSPEPAIVPPTWNKTQYHQEIGTVWRRAADHLSEAENIFIIGYSLPETDQFFRYLYSLGTVGEVLLGGPFPTSMPKTILKNRSFVEAVVVGDGEEALHKYISNEPYESIPNLCFRKGGAIVQNPENVLELESLPYPDYLNLPLEKYFESYETRYSDFKPFRKSLAIYSRKGCIWRDASNGGCVFCMIPHKGIRYKSPKRFWKEIAFYNRRYGVNYFWEVCDTFTENSRWIDDFVRSKPGDLDVSFHVYGVSSNISRKMASQLKELGVYEVFIGAESGDDGILALMNKGIKVDQTRRAVEFLAEQGINVVVSFVFGLPGETSQTLQKTFDLARELYLCGNIVETSSSVLLPIPGSNAFDLLMQIPGMREKHSSDLLDLEELKIDWIKNFTRTTPAELRSALETTLDIFPLTNTFIEKDARSAPMC